MWHHNQEKKTRQDKKTPGKCNHITEHMKSFTTITTKWIFWHGIRDVWRMQYVAEGKTIPAKR